MPEIFSASPAPDGHICYCALRSTDAPSKAAAMIPTEALQCAEQYAAHAHHFWNSGMGGTECRKLEDSPQMLRLHL